MARRNRKTRFNLAEYQRLTRELTRDPHLVLAHFQAQGIASLEEIACWKDICLYQPAAADCIRYVAGLLDIPEKHGKE